MHEHTDPFGQAPDPALETALWAAARSGQAAARPVSPAEIRARAVRRHRRRVVLTTAAAATALVASAGVVSALTTVRDGAVGIPPATTGPPAPPATTDPAPPSPSGESSPSPGITTGSDPALLTAADLKPVFGARRVPAQTETLERFSTCQQKDWSALHPRSSQERSFDEAEPGEVVAWWAAHQTVMRFGTEAQAKQAIATLRAWMADCPRYFRAVAETGGPPASAKASRRPVPGADATAWRVDFERNPLEVNVEYIGVGRRGKVVTLVVLADKEDQATTVEPWPSTVMVRRSLERVGG